MLSLIFDIRWMMVKFDAFCKILKKNQKHKKSGFRHF